MKRVLKQIKSPEAALRYFDATGKEISKGNLRGDVSGLRGDVSGLTGDVDDADLSSIDRKNGVSIRNLIKE